MITAERVVEAITPVLDDMVRLSERVRVVGNDMLLWDDRDRHIPVARCRPPWRTGSAVIACHLPAHSLRGWALLAHVLGRAFGDTRGFSWTRAN